MIEKETTNSKYLPFALMIVIVVVTLIVTGFADLVSWIFAGNIAMLCVVVLLEERTRKAMKSKDAQEIVKFESPIAWLKFCLLFSTLSLLTSIGYTVITDLGVQTDMPIFGNNYLLFFTVGFFCFAILLFLRASLFIIDPSSKFNISAGKIIYKVVDAGFRITVLVSLLLFQIFNGLMLWLIIEGLLAHVFATPILVIYALTIIMSFIAIIPIFYNIILHPKKHINRLGVVTLFIFYSPWFVLIGIGLLLQLGLNVI